MEIDTKDEITIKNMLPRVTMWRTPVAEECLKYFKQHSENEKWFIGELEELRWRNKFIGQYRNHISLTAAPLAIKIYDQLELITFPFIHRVACRGWDTAGGTWAWSMKVVSGGQYTEDVGSADPVKYCLKKDVILDILDSGEIVGGTKALGDKG